MPPRVVSSLRNNADSRFPKKGGFYCASWVPPNDISADEAIVFARDLADALEPSQKAPVVMLLTRLAAHFWSDRGEAQWQIVIEDYADDLCAFSLDLIVDGITTYRQTHKWWPKGSELVELIRPQHELRALQYQRLCKIAGIEPAEKRPRMETAVQSMLTTFAAKSAEALENRSRWGDD